MTFGGTTFFRVVAALAALSLLFALLMTIGLITDQWSATDDGFFGALLAAAVVAGLFGPFVALGGVYLLRRAVAEGRSPDRARALIVAGTVGIAFLGGAMFWTVIGPIIAIAILAYWSRQLREWRQEQLAAS